MPVFVEFAADEDGDPEGGIGVDTLAGDILVFVLLLLLLLVKDVDVDDDDPG